MERKYDFWNNWKNKTRQELQYIESLKKTRSLILRKFSRNKIHAIYVKGSFVRRELTPRSDIDIVVITSDNRLLNKIIRFSEENKEALKPSEIVTPYSVWELKYSKIYPKKQKKMTPSVFLFHLDRHKIVYGKSIINVSHKAKINDSKHRLKGLINFLEKKYLPAYKKGKSWGFRYLAKQVFWLADLELMIKGNHSPHSFKEMAKRVKDKNHIIHDAIKIRKMKTTKNPKLRKDFMKKLKTYLNSLKKL